MFPPALQSLLHRPDLWRGRDRSSDRSRPAVLPSGFSALDSALHYGGWPAHGLSEVLCDALCPLRLLLPALAQAAREGLIVLANPPAQPGAQAWAAAGIDLSRLLLLSAPASHGALLRRACLEAASSDAVAALLLWLPASERDPRLLRRLHRAAQQGRCWLVVIREPRFRQQSSPAPLRLQLTAGADSTVMTLDILKQPGGWAGQQLMLPWVPVELGRARPATARAVAPAHMRTEAPVVAPVIAQPAPPPEPPEHRLGLPGKDAPPPALALPGRRAGDAPTTAGPASPVTPKAPATDTGRRRKRRVARVGS